MAKKSRKMTKPEIKACATARASAGMISQLKDGNFVDYWVPRLAGRYVTGPNGYKFSTREEAITEARLAKANFAAALS